MFRRLPETMPEDFKFPPVLKKLGYYINNADQVRSIEHPDQEYNFFISKNDRVNVMQREAFNTCLRENIHDRLLQASMEITRLPLDASLITPHIPIWTSANLATTKRVVVYIGETMQDLGVLAYRTIGRDSIGAGSIINLVKAVQAYPDCPGLIIANPGQLLWFRGGQKAITATSWEAIPKDSAVSPAMEIDEEKNRVRGNATPDEHVRSIFEEVIMKMTNKDAAIDVVGNGDGALILVEYLQNNWSKWANRIQAAAIGTNFVWEGVKFDNENFKEFWSNRARAYLMSDEPLTTSLTGRNDFGCNCYSAGENQYVECIMPRIYKSVLDFFYMVGAVPGYRELEALDEIDGDFTI